MIKNKKPKLNKLTFRQYMAFSLIYSTYMVEGRIPSVSEIKKVIGFKSDRMLDITLTALKKKELIDYNSHGIEIKDDVLELANQYIDPLMASKNYISFKELMDKLSNELKHKKTTNNKLNPKPPQIDVTGGEKEFISYLNNEKKIFHRWYPFLQDFPPSLIYNKIEEFNIDKNGRILDPFAGSGTTLVTSKLLGIDAIGTDVNPVASFTSKVKTTWDVDKAEILEYGNKILGEYEHVSPLLGDARLKTKFTESMGFLELHQWLKPKTQNEIAFLRERIYSEIEESPEKDIFKLALIEAAIESSNVSFCPGTTFYPFRDRPALVDSFKHKLEMIYEDLNLIQNLQKYRDKEANVAVYNQDCRKAKRYVDSNSVDFIITSPPYPNDLEYTRQTRLEMYLLDYVKNMKDVRQIKRKMVKGSTKLIYKDSNSEKYVKKFDSIEKVANQIDEALKDRNWGWDYPRMTREYFGDMYLALKEFYNLLKDDGRCLLVVGDQTYKKVVIPVGKILAELGRDIGYHFEEIQQYRLRRSTAHNIPLPEEIVVLRK